MYLCVSPRIHVRPSNPPPLAHIPLWLRSGLLQHRAPGREYCFPHQKCKYVSPHSSFLPTPSASPLFTVLTLCSFRSTTVSILPVWITISCVTSAYPADRAEKGGGHGGEGKTRICGFTFGFLVLGVGFRYAGGLITLDGRPSKSRGRLPILLPGGRDELDGLFRLGMQIWSPSRRIRDVQHTPYILPKNKLYILHIDSS
jgi:hypothetical protein